MHGIIYIASYVKGERFIFLHNSEFLSKISHILGMNTSKSSGN